MGCIEDIFSEENILAYAGACLDLAVNIPERRRISLFDTLVIPSRGAVPFFLGMVHALRNISLISEDHKGFYENIGVQKMLVPLLPSDSKVSNDVENKKIKVLLAPFTADLNIESIYPDEKNMEYTKMTREYWAHVTASLFKQRSGRVKDPYFRSFVDIILREIEGRSRIVEMYEGFPKVERFAMIDTVISGRAATDILRAFDNISFGCKNPNLKPEAFLVIDENGRKLKPMFLSYLKKKKLEGEAEFYHIPRIVSEDKGASLLGVSAVVYPSMMKASKRFEINGREFFFGAGSWHLASDLQEGDINYYDNFSRFMRMIYRAIDAKYTADYVGSVDSSETEVFRRERDDFVKCAEKNKILAKHQPDISIININNNYTPYYPYETSSHVVHIPFDDKSIEKVLSLIAAIPEVTHKKL